MSLKLLANDADDLKVLASALQDAILRVGDIRYDAVGRSVSFRLSRYRHEAGQAARVLAGLRVDGVMALQSQAFDRTTSDAYAVLLDIGFEEIDAPAGTLLISLAGGGKLRMQVESLDLLLADVGEPRRTKATPDHE